MSLPRSNEEGGSALIHANARLFARQGRLTTGKAAKAPSPLVEVAQSEFKVQRQVHQTHP